MTLLIVWSDIAKSEPPTFSDFFTENTITENSGENVFFTFQALDPDDPDSEISFNLTGPDRNDFRIGRSDGGLYFRTAPDYENPTDDDEDNVYEITVVATDQDKEKTRIKATVTISNVDDEVPRIRQNLTRIVKLSKVLQNPTKLARTVDPIRSLIGHAGGRFYVNEYRSIFTPRMNQETGIDYKYCGRINLENWFSEPMIPTLPPDHYFF